MVKMIPFMLLLYIAFAGCEDELFGPDLGPTAGPEHNGLRIEVLFPDTVGIAEQVAFHVALTNTRTVPYTMPQPHFDVFVIDSGGDVVWNYLFEAGVFGDEVVIEAGEAFEIDLVWNQNRNEAGNIQPGKYSVLAVFFDLPPALVSERLSIVIERDS